MADQRGHVVRIETTVTSLDFGDSLVNSRKWSDISFVPMDPADGRLWETHCGMRRLGAVHKVHESLFECTWTASDVPCSVRVASVESAVLWYAMKLQVARDFEEMPMLCDIAPVVG